MPLEADYHVATKRQIVFWSLYGVLTVLCTLNGKRWLAHQILTTVRKVAVLVKMESMRALKAYKPTKYRIPKYHC
jgi:hypothetical protein